MLSTFNNFVFGVLYAIIRTSDDIHHQQKNPNYSNIFSHLLWGFLPFLFVRDIILPTEGPFSSITRALDPFVLGFFLNHKKRRDKEKHSFTFSKESYIFEEFFQKKNLEKYFIFMISNQFLQITNPFLVSSICFHSPWSLISFLIQEG